MPPPPRPKPAVARAPAARRRRPAVALAAKLVAPDARHAIARPRLFEALDGAPAAAWIAGGPGAGKTTLAASWCERSGRAPLWVQVDAEDAQPSTFFHYLGLAAAAAGTKPPLPRVDAAAREDWPAFARRTARDLATRLPARTPVVFDNVHEAHGPVREFLEALAGEFSGSLRLLLLSRESPGGGFAEAVARRRLGLVSPEALRFDERETGELARSLGAGDTLDAAALHRATGGWAAGIVLLGPRSRTAALQDGTGDERLFDAYFARVLAELPPRLAALVEACALLPDFDAALAGAAGGEPAAGPLLEDLHARAIFVERREHAGAAVYQFHPLVAGALRRRLAGRGPAALAEARLRAGRLLARSSREPAAVGELLAAGAWEEAAEVLEANAAAWLRAGRHEQLAGWIERLPSTGAVLAWRHALALAVTDMDRALARLREAFAGFETAGEALGMQRVAAEAVCLTAASWRHFEGWLWWLEAWRRAMALPAAYPDPLAELEILSGVMAASSLGETAPGHSEVLARLAALVPAVDDPEALLTAASSALNFCNERRLLDEAMPFANLMNARLRGLPPGSVVRRCEWELSQALMLSDWSVHLSRPELRERSRVHLDRAREIAAEGALAAQRIVLSIVEARSITRAGDALEGCRRLDQVGDELRADFPRPAVWFHSERCQARLRSDDLRGALEDAGAALRLCTGAGWPRPFTAYYFAILAITQFRLGRTEEALPLVDEAIARAAAGHNLTYRNTRRLMLVHRALGSGEDPAPLLAELFGDLAAQRAFQFGLLSPGEVAVACHEALARGIEAPFVRELVRRRELRPPAGAGAAWPWPVEVRALGGFALRRFGEPVAFEGKSQRRPLEMLQRLVAGGPARARIESVIDDLWGVEDAKDPKGSFSVTLHRLRRLLGTDAAVAVADGRVGLDPALVWCDAWAFEAAAKAGGDPGGTLALYAGPLLGTDATPHWAAVRRERLAVAFASLVERAAAGREAGGDYAGAIAIWERGLAQDDLVEGFYRGLIRCHLAVGERAEALRAYRRCRERLSLVLGLKPAAETEALRTLIPGD